MPYAISICVAVNPILYLYPRVKKSGENGTVELHGKNQIYLMMSKGISIVPSTES